MKKFLIESKKKMWHPFDGWITILEMKAFGWHYCGEHTKYYDEYFVTYHSSNDTVSVNQKSENFYTFERVKPYTSNPLFIILEGLMTIQSWIRRKLIFLLWFITAAVFVIGLIMSVNKGGISQEILYSLYMLMFIYCPSLAYAILGFLVRKIFRIDSRLKNQLELNGYSREQF